LGVPDLGDEFRMPFRSDVPVLLISGTLDGRTSDTDARRVGAQFRQANYITLKGASHDFFFVRPPTRFTEVIVAFLHGEPVLDEQIEWPVQFKWPE
jgi:pimeloyl-ACP methyl ester carboxylesterase